MRCFFVHQIPIYCSKVMQPGTRLCDIYVPSFEGEPLDPDVLVKNVGRGDVMQVFAQMECALKKS